MQTAKRAHTGYRHLQISLEDHLGQITLNRPPVNALNQDLVAELTAVAKSLRKRSDIWVVTLTASGRTFCAGADLKERAGIPRSRSSVIV